ncbi:MAG TPA: D-aminoacyl-tRNA deacylase [Polyangiaceae bacterium]|jgi:D-tyrosyl-tRNA(Tyr) deacylase|nr:D-aminoacyl-tRNA deacylase [Polyangiaceae bacterium]
MRAVVQRVRSARVEVEGEVVGAIGPGLLALIGFGRGDTSEDRAWVLTKIANLRVFEGDAADTTDPQARIAARKMDRSVSEIGGAVLLVSQFTLYGDVLRGRRPSFDDAMPPEQAQAAYDAAVREMRAMGVRVETGRFRAAMDVHSHNDGPVTLWIDSAVRRSSPR